MRPAIALAALAFVIGAAVCVRLGFWQISRYELKRALSARHAAALAAPPLTWDGSATLREGWRDRRLELHGRYDQAHHVLLAFQEHEGAPGVELVTPLVLESGTRVLIDRGWLPSEDSEHARPQDFPEPGPVTVLGVAETLAHGRFAMHALESDSVSVLSARALDPDTVAARLPGPLAPFVVRQLPGPGVPARPLRCAPEPLDTGMHLGYAIQWFLIAVVMLVGGFFFLRSITRNGREAGRAVLGSASTRTRQPPTP